MTLGYSPHERETFILRLIRNRNDIIIRRTDKSRVFYENDTNEFARKAA